MPQLQLRGSLTHYVNSCVLQNQGGVTLILSVLQSVTAVKWQVNGQGSFKAKDNGQMLLVDGQSYTNRVVHKNIAKINGMRSIKGQDKILAKVNNQSWTYFDCGRRS